MKLNQISAVPAQQPNLVVLSCALDVISNIAEVESSRKRFDALPANDSNEPGDAELIAALFAPVLDCLVNTIYGSFFAGVPKYARALLSPIDRPITGQDIAEVLKLTIERDESPSVAGKIGACLACVLVKTEIRRQATIGQTSPMDADFSKTVLARATSELRTELSAAARQFIEQKYPQFIEGTSLDVSFVVPTCPLILIGPTSVLAPLFSGAFQRELGAMADEVGTEAARTTLERLLSTPEAGLELPAL